MRTHLLLNGYDIFFFSIVNNYSEVTLTYEKTQKRDAVAFGIHIINITMHSCIVLGNEIRKRLSPIKSTIFLY